MLKNSISIKKVSMNDKEIIYNYDIDGDWKEAFNEKEKFNIVYNKEIENVPESVAIIPFLANLLPIAWVYDAEINADICDEDFYKSIPEFKKGYINMYPNMNFKGKLNINCIEKNIANGSRKAAFFSGGVDAFNTLVCNIDSKPILITLWGADIKLSDYKGWDTVLKHLQETSKEFGLDYITVKSSFRNFINEEVLQKKVKESGDGWWHGFQHGLGIYSHAAPIAYKYGISDIRFASSFTAADKGKVTCASDPTIDNFVRFCGGRIVHDGYEFNRQQKIHNIVTYSRNNGIKIPLRVCWESSGGSNCCNCEKCWRTILGIYAEGENPSDYGFNYKYKQLNKLALKMKYSNDEMFGKLRYSPIQIAMHKNIDKKDLPHNIRWFYNCDLNKIGKKYLLGKLSFKIYKYIKKLLIRSRNYEN